MQYKFFITLHDYKILVMAKQLVTMGLIKLH